MERRGRASDCQRSHDFTQNDLPPPLTGAGIPRREHGTPSGIRADIRRGGAAPWAGDGAACPLSRLRRRDPPQVAWSTRAVQCASRIHPRGLPALHWVRFPWTGYEGSWGLWRHFARTLCSPRGDPGGTPSAAKSTRCISCSKHLRRLNPTEG
jgi:hypothetical protein